MIRIYTPVLLLLGALIFPSCSSKDDVQDNELASRIDEFQAVLEDTSTTSEHFKKQKELIEALNRDYPAAVPIGRDSIKKIPLAKLPAKVGRFPMTLQEITYKKPSTLGKDTLVFYQNKDYGMFGADYSLPTTREIESEGFNLYLMDRGFYPQWVLAFMHRDMNKGKAFGGMKFALLFTGAKFQESIDFQGQRWAVWKSVPRPKYDGNRRLPRPAKVFTTYWNDRFEFITITTDTAVTSPDYLTKIVDFEWMKQLGYPQK